MSEGERLIEALGLQPHPEGGHYRETFRDKASKDGRANSTAIYFLLRQGEQSRWHRIDAAEIWHWYAGAPLLLSIVAEAGAIERKVLGSDLEKAERPQVVVPPWAWQ